jgi:AcrR family transcriptional regulator
MATKEDVYQAALEIFASKGYSASSMDEIAAKVGIKKASLYNHFPGKEYLLEEAYRRLRAKTLPAEAPQDDRQGEEAAIAEPESLAWSGAEQALRAIIERFISAWGDRETDLMWTVVSEEQYVDPRAAAIIFDLTELYLARTAAFFEKLRAASLTSFEGEARTRAEVFSYAIRAMHLEYGLRKRHGADVEPILRSMRALASFFA